MSWHKLCLVSQHILQDNHLHMHNNIYDSKINKNSVHDFSLSPAV